MGVLSRWRQEFLERSFEGGSPCIFFHATQSDSTSAKSAPSSAGRPTATASAIPRGSYLLQVVALRTESDAVSVANELRKKKFPAFVQAPQGDKYYRVQVGPYADLKAMQTAKKGLETAGFKAIIKH